MSLCVVFVCNKKYLDQFNKTYKQLRTIGNYNGEVTLVIGNDLSEQEILESNNNLNVIKFPDFEFDESFMSIFNNLNRPGMWKNKIFQYHKFHLFDLYFKKWDYIFYIDSGINIKQSIQPLIDCKKKDTLLAHSDAYPTYQWKLNHQFNKCTNENQKNLFNELNNKFDLNIDYFQTTIMLYDTSIIHYNLKQNIYKLSLEYPISFTNDQGIIALYFTNIDKKWEQIPLHNNDKSLYYYDYLKRNGNYKYIMTKR
jgi:hypothetical protein